jgi:hypothetical protein
MASPSLCQPLKLLGIMCRLLLYAVQAVRAVTSLCALHRREGVQPDILLRRSTHEVRRRAQSAVPCMSMPLALPPAAVELVLPNAVMISTNKSAACCSSAACSCYHIDYVPGDYTSRQAACRALGGDLVMYQSIGEQVGGTHGCARGSASCWLMAAAYALEIACGRGVTGLLDGGAGACRCRYAPLIFCQAPQRWAVRHVVWYAGLGPCWPMMRSLG